MPAGRPGIVGVTHVSSGRQNLPTEKQIQELDTKSGNLFTRNLTSLLDFFFPFRSGRDSAVKIGSIFNNNPRSLDKSVLDKLYNQVYLNSPEFLKILEKENQLTNNYRNLQSSNSSVKSQGKLINSVDRGYSTVVHPSTSIFNFSQQIHKIKKNYSGHSNTSDLNHSLELTTSQTAKDPNSNVADKIDFLNQHLFDTTSSDPKSLVQTDYEAENDLFLSNKPRSSFSSKCIPNTCLPVTQSFSSLYKGHQNQEQNISNLPNNNSHHLHNRPGKLVGQIVGGTILDNLSNQQQVSDDHKYFAMIKDTSFRV